MIVHYVQIVLYSVSFAALAVFSLQIFKARRIFYINRPWLKLKKTSRIFESEIKGSSLERDGEIIAFCRLYELTKAKRNLQLSVFSENVAHHFPHIRSDLLHFSQMLTTSGSEAYSWLERRFPKSPFIRNICVFLQTAESLSDPSQFLKQNAVMLEKLSADHYKRRKDYLSPIFTAINNIPTMLVFLTVILMMIRYMNLIQTSILY